MWLDEWGPGSARSFPAEFWGCDFLKISVCPLAWHLSPLTHSLSCLSSALESLCTKKRKHSTRPFPLSFTCPYSALVVLVHVGPSFCSLGQCVVPHPRSPKGDHPSPLFRLKASFAPSLSTAQGVGSRSSRNTHRQSLCVHRAYGRVSPAGTQLREKHPQPLTSSQITGVLNSLQALKYDLGFPMCSSSPSDKGCVGKSREETPSLLLCQHTVLLSVQIGTALSQGFSRVSFPYRH